MLWRATADRHSQQPREPSILQGPLRDELRRQLVVKGFDAQKIDATGMPLRGQWGRADGPAAH
jgi:hypothetical protein